MKKGYYSSWDDHDDYDYGYRSPNSSKKKSYYGGFDWEPGKWSSYSWGSSLFDNDDNSKLFVKDPVTYITPTKQEIKTKASVWADKSLDTIKELARVCYFKMIDERDYFEERFKDPDTLDESVRADYDQKKSLYDSIFETFIPGNTPLEQAIAIHRQMSNVTEYGAVGREKLDMDATLHFDRKIYADPTINEQLEFNELSKQRKMDILDKISIIGQLGDQFKVEKEVDEKIVSNSETYSKKIMRDYAQFSNIELYQKMFPHFSTKFLTKDLIVNVPVDKKEKKQKIIMLLDFSGSMSETEKQTWVNAIMIDRLRYVMQEEAEVFFSYFVSLTETLKFHHLKNRDDVMKFWTWFSNDPNGGMTDIGGNVTYIANEIEKGQLHNLQVDLRQEKPEILIINDGQDSVGYKTFPYKVNAISLMQFSNELKDLCVGAKGKQVQVSYDNSITCYSDEGISKLTDGKNIQLVEKNEDESLMAQF